MMEYTREFLSTVFDFDQETQVFRWREREETSFDVENHKRRKAICGTWNKRFAGKMAFSLSDGYYRARVGGERIYRHRAAFAMYHGSAPDELQIRHRNGNTADDSKANLEPVTVKELSRRQSMRVVNTSGVVGVHWDASRKAWKAEIMIDGKAKFLGRFGDIADAYAARKHAETEEGFHPQHGQEGIVRVAPLVPHT